MSCVNLKNFSEVFHKLNALSHYLLLIIKLKALSQTHCSATNSMLFHKVNPLSQKLNTLSLTLFFSQTHYSFTILNALSKT